MGRKLISRFLVPEDESGETVLAAKLERYSDEPDVTGEVVSRRVEIVPGVWATVEFVLLWRAQ